MASRSSEDTRTRRHLVVIAYDVANDRRRARVARILEGAGRRVQESVFECYLERSVVERVRNRLARIVQPADSVRFYELCRTDRRLSRASGRGPAIASDVAFYIVSVDN